VTRPKSRHGAVEVAEPPGRVAMPVDSVPVRPVWAGSRTLRGGGWAAVSVAYVAGLGGGS
jgi:hypothetical protein